MRKKITYLLAILLIISCGILFGSTKEDNRIIGTRTVAEGDVLSFSLSVSDLDGDVVTIIAEKLPVGATLSPAIEMDGKYVSNFNWTPNFDQAGIINVWFIAEDTPGAQDWVAVTLTIINTNRPPVFNDL